MNLPSIKDRTKINKLYVIINEAIECLQSMTSESKAYFTEEKDKDLFEILQSASDYISEGCSIVDNIDIQVKEAMLGK